MSTCEEEGWSKGSMDGLESNPKVGEGVTGGDRQQKMGVLINYS